MQFTRTIALHLIIVSLVESDGIGTPDSSIIQITDLKADGGSSYTPQRTTGLRFPDVRKKKGDRIPLTVKLRCCKAWSGLIRIGVNPVQVPSGGAREVAFEADPATEDEGEPRS